MRGLFHAQFFGAWAEQSLSSRTIPQDAFGQCEH
jgi:hypothetical protein